MKVSVLKSILPTVLSAVIATAFTQACSVGSSLVSAQTTETADPIEGLWSSQVTVTNCQTGAVMRSFAALNLFARGGTVIDTDSQPPTGHGPGFGVWTDKGAAQYTSSFQFYRFNTDGSLAGSQQIARTITLAAGGQSFTSDLNVSILDTNGNSIGSACGTETATKAPQS
jgi:hypothetical protein